MKLRIAQPDVAGVALMGVAYVGVQYWMPVILGWFGAVQQPTIEEWQFRGTKRLLFIYGVDFVVVLLVAICAGYRRSDLRHKRTFVPSLRDWLLLGLPTAFISLLLAIVGLWPWTWQWPPYNGLNLGHALLTGRQFLGLAIWGFATVGLIPLLEETLFRFGMLRFFGSVSGSAAFGVLASSVLFAGAHLGGMGIPDRAHSTNALWLFFASLAVGSITLQNGGRLGPAIAAHTARNAIEFSMLLLALFQS